VLKQEQYEGLGTINQATHSSITEFRQNIPMYQTLRATGNNTKQFLRKLHAARQRRK